MRFSTFACAFVLIALSACSRSSDVGASPGMSADRKQTPRASTGRDAAADANTM